jgi:ribonuclease BN (tRNA processing enzyme)
MTLALRFLGVGSAQAVELGSASAVLERDGQPLLAIDCGPEALSAYLARYSTPPSAVFVTHTHLDHVGGLERLFYRTYFDDRLRGNTRLYVPAPLVPLLQERIAGYPEVLAEGGANFWDTFRLVPVAARFWHEGLRFDVFAVRHHAPNTAFGLALRGAFVYTGDTRPIPEVLEHYGTGTELVAHDCGLTGNPSHTGLDDLPREYSEAVRKRLLLYHFGSAGDARAIAAAGYAVAEAGRAVELAAPDVQARLA